MENSADRAIAIVGLGAVLPDAPNVAAFWENVKTSRYSITDVTPDRWDPTLYYDPDPAAPDKSYSKIGGWVRDYPWEPMKWRLAIPPRVADAMDATQKWAIACTRQALEDYGYPNRPLNADRTAVILGTAMGGEQHYLTSLRAYFPEYARELSASATFAALPEGVRRDITRELHDRIAKYLPEITEDSMPGELANCVAGRIANLFNFHGSNYIVDAACASAMAALSSAMEGLIERDFDVAICGGIDRNMGAPTFIKFCKIGALSATGSRPYADGADGFVMGEGAALFLLKRLADAERDGDKVYAVLRGIGGSSDGKGKGITAPNPVGPKLAIERGWQNAGLSPAPGTLIEGHGTSTRVGDLVEMQCMVDVFSSFHLPNASVALGSVKSNIGHLKGAAGAAGLLKAVLALHEKVLPPSVNGEHPNPGIDFAHAPFFINTELKPWTIPDGETRRAGLSAFGFGGTNFHAVLEEYIPHKLNGNGKRSVAVEDVPQAASTAISARDVASAPQVATSFKAPLRGAAVLGAATPSLLVERLRALLKDAEVGRVPPLSAPADSDLRAPERLAIDYADAKDLAAKCTAALKALAANQPAMWKAIRAQGIFRGQGSAPKVAFLYTGQGSQYVNMLKPLRAREPIVADTFAEADRVMTPLLGKPLSDFIFIDGEDGKAVEQAEDDLRQTAITQPAVLATDLAMARLLSAYGIEPDFTMGHSLGEYGALEAAGGIPFADALEAVSARGREMTRVSMEDNGRMAAIFAPLEEIEKVLKTVDGYVVIANINSEHQSVIGGASHAVQCAMEAFQKAGYDTAALPVSHAFHTSIVAPASQPMRDVLKRLRLQSPRLPIVSNVNGTFYPTGPNVVPQMLDILAKQIASPVQFIKGLRTLYDAGARIFVEVGPKKALQGFADDVLGSHGDVVALFTNHPKSGDVVSFNQALCGLYAAGLGRGIAEQNVAVAPIRSSALSVTPLAAAPMTVPANGGPAVGLSSLSSDKYNELGQMFAEVLERGWQMYQPQNGKGTFEPVVITGAAIGLPGTEHIFDDSNIARILRGDQFIGSIPTRFRDAMLDKHIIRLVKSDNGGPTFETIDDVADVIKLAARGNAFDLAKEFGVPADRISAFDRVTALAIAAGIDALRDAGIPLVMRYKTTTKGTQLPDRWALPEALRDNTGVVFASAFPGYNSFAEIMSDYYTDHGRREQRAVLEQVRSGLAGTHGQAKLVQEVDRRIQELDHVIEAEPFVFDRRFLFRVLAMGHSQFAEYIGARGPNTQINAACASTTLAVSLAEDWIRAGRCRRVLVVSADDVTSDSLIDWIGAGFLATGAAATDDVVEDAALPFDRRRHGMIIGMGAAALVVESAEAARERGLRPICEVLSAAIANSAFHATRLDVQHIAGVMEGLVSRAEAHSGIERHQIAPRTIFMSHETYTPARGGSASAEIHALRQVFGAAADQIVIANTKGFTGHAMATGIEDVVAVKALETGCVPPVPNFQEIDPELGQLNLSRGGNYPVEYALRLGAGFGSQISMMLLHRVARTGVYQAPDALGYGYRIADPQVWKRWLSSIAGQGTTDLEVVQRTLRLRTGKAAARTVESVTTAVSVPAPAPKPSGPAAAAVVEKRPIIEKATVVEKGPVPSPSPAAASVAVQPAPQATAAATVPQSDSVKERVLALVVEKTGYPAEMLDLDLDLEADLGIDTVKQAELFAAIREIYNIERDENRKLRDYPTLSHVIRFVYENRPDLQAGTVAAKTTVAVAVSETKSTSDPVSVAPKVQGDVKERIVALVVEKTGYPAEMLDFDLDLEADLGIDTVKQAELFAAIREIYNIPRDENRKLRDYPTLSHVIRFVYENRPDLQARTAASPAPTVTVPETKLAAEPVGLSPNTNDDVKERILTLVVEKTGYPAEMLDLDLDLEADLGIDTVKQAELFAAIREIYNIPRDENRKLRDYPTLSHVIRFVYENRPDLQAGTAVPTQASTVAIPVTKEAVSEQVSAPPKTEGDVKERVLALVVEKTGYPVEMLDLDLDLEADLGIDTVKQAELFAAIRDIYSIPRDENRKLRDYPTLSHVIQFVYENRPDLANTAKPTPAPSQPEAAPAAAPDDDSVREKILEIVADKTGYPKEMLDLDLDLEADLGIDTVKQAEMFAAVRAAYNIPRDENLKLRDFPTLAHVIQFALDRRPSVAPSQPSASPAPANKQPAPGPDSAIARPPLATFDAADRVPRRVPVPQPRPALAICKSTGVTLGPGRRVVLMPDNAGVAKQLRAKLEAMGVEALWVDGAPSANVLTGQLKSWLSAGPVHGVYWLPGLDHEGPIEALDLSTWREALHRRVKLLYATMRMLYEQISPAGTFLVSASQLGGQHGYDRAGAVAPLGGAVTGFTKAYKRERNDALVKAVDFEVGPAPFEIADILIQETLRDPAVVEIGYQQEQRWTIGLEEQSAADGQPGLTLDSKTVFLITGAAGSIVSAITSDLAAASGGTFYLLDVVPKPDPANPDLKKFVSDKDNLKRELFARIQARGERATPALVEKELAAIERAVAAQAAINAVTAAGGTAYYFSANLTDPDAVTKVIHEVRQHSGRIDVLLHAAGIERSHFLPDKEPAEFDLVFDVKCDGFFNLLHAMGGMPLGATVVFSSIAGRFGNGGQTDYSSANDLLCKITSSFRTSRQQTRGIAIDWTAWGGIGMASRGSIPKMMELAGIDMLPPEAGIPVIRRELTTGAARGEIVIAQRLGVLLKEWDPDGGIDLSLASMPVKGPMLGTLTRNGEGKEVTCEARLDPAVQPFLHDHQIEGTPVLPGVMGVEAFAEAAACQFPGWHVYVVENVDFLSPFKFYRSEPRTVTTLTQIHSKDNVIVTDCQLTGSRTLPHQSEPQVATHFTGRVRLVRELPQAVSARPLGAPTGQVVKADTIYRVYFHGPAYQVLERAWWDGVRMVGLMSDCLPPNHQPADLKTLMEPRLIELCFQTAGLWDLGIRGRMCLPQHFEEVRLERSSDRAEGRLYAIATPDPTRGSFDVEVVDEAGNRYLYLAGYRTIPLPDGADAEALRELQGAMSPEAVMA
jgi:acyl transferase domain-containing protein/acyl carrier protein/NAD(P)-dependent dehydrogenase (short-subunit alcohol dehydrogenase family)